MDRLNCIKGVRAHFPAAARTAYLNTPTFGLVPDFVYEATQRSQDYRYETGDYAFLGGPQYAMIEETRQVFADFLNCTADDIAFGLSASQLFPILSAGLDIKPGDNVVVPANSFITIPYAFQARAAEGLEVRYAPVREGRLLLEDLYARVDERTRAIAVNHVESATGYRLALEELGAFCKARGIPLAVDAAQSAGAMHIDVEKMGISFLVGTDYKWLCHYRGFGFAYVNAALRASLCQHAAGWASELERFNTGKRELTLHPGARRYELGGLHNSGVYSVGQVLRFNQEIGQKNIEAALLALVSYCYQKAEESGHVRLKWRFPEENRSSIVVLQIPAEYPLTTAALKERGVTASVGGGPAPGYGEASPFWSIRIGLHYYNTTEDIDRLFAAVEDCCG